MNNNMAQAELSRLREAVAAVAKRLDVSESIGRLKRKLRESADAFVWSEVDLRDVRVPAEIRSVWIFVLKAQRWSEAHFHPNSIQYMVVLEGEAFAKIGEDFSALSGDDWTVIDAGVPHEFYPIGQEMVVMSFHTADAEALLEVAASDSRARRYN